MQDNPFWRIAAMVLCGALFYVGHGLHNPESAGRSPFENVARAGGVAVTPNAIQIFTASQDGRTLYEWRDLESGVRYLAKATVPPENVHGPRK